MSMDIELKAVRAPKVRKLPLLDVLVTFSA
jgi:hypothetical protein